MTVASSHFDCAKKEIIHATRNDSLGDERFSQ